MYSNIPTSTTSNTRSKTLRRFFGIALIAGFSFILGYQVATDGYRFSPSAQGLITKVPSMSDTTLDLDPFWRVLGLVEEHYIGAEELDEEALVDGAIKGLVDSLEDPYSYYLTTDETDSFQEGLDGVYEGIGVQLGYEGDNLVVIAPLTGGPAEAAGVRAGDLILAVEGESIAPLNLGEVVQRVRGEEGTTVNITFARKNNEDVYEQLDIDITRAEINAPNILVSREDDGIVVVNILRFGTDIVEEWKQIVKDEDLANANAVLIDVRSNPGGYLNGAAAIVSSFVPSGVIVSQEYADGTTDDYTSNKDGELIGKPVTVLINGSSASASEILAGALRISAGATLVGEQSFGKNTVQEAYQLGEGTSVHITAAHWLLPNGERIPDDGIAPDEVVESVEDQDVQKERALEILEEKI